MYRQLEYQKNAIILVKTTTSSQETNTRTLGQKNLTWKTRNQTSKDNQIIAKKPTSEHHNQSLIIVLANNYTVRIYSSSR